MKDKDSQLIYEAYEEEIIEEEAVTVAAFLFGVLLAALEGDIQESWAKIKARVHRFFAERADPTGVGFVVTTVVDNHFFEENMEESTKTGKRVLKWVLGQIIVGKGFFGYEVDRAMVKRFVAVLNKLKGKSFTEEDIKCGIDPRIKCPVGHPDGPEEQLELPGMPGQTPSVKLKGDDEHTRRMNL